MTSSVLDEPTLLTHIQELLRKHFELTASRKSDRSPDKSTTYLDYGKSAPITPYSRMVSSIIFKKGKRIFKKALGLWKAIC